MKSNTIGSIVKELRIEKGYNQTQLAKMVGVTGAYISQIETGKWTPSAKLLGNIMKAPKLTKKAVVNTNNTKVANQIKKAIDNQVSMPTPNGKFKRIIITFE